MRSYNDERKIYGDGDELFGVFRGRGTRNEEIKRRENGGSIAVGKEADFITISLRQPHLYPTGNLVNTLLECVTAADVCDNVVRGKILMKDHAVQTLDEARVLAKAERYFEQAEKITP